MRQSYGKEDKEKIFWIWYNNGQLSGPRLLIFLQEQDHNAPARTTLEIWIRSWKERAAELDQEIKDKFTKEVIETKVEMLRRHAEVGKELQVIGMDWIRTHKDSLTAASVTRIIKDGYEMERASVGVPEALEKMLSSSDEDLVKQIESALAGEDVDLLNAD